MFGEQRRPLLISMDLGGRELPLESLLTDPRKKTSLLGPGRPEVGPLDPHRGAPDLYVRDQVNRQPTPVQRPGWHGRFPRRSDLVSEVGYQSGPSGQVRSPIRVPRNAGGYAGQPRQQAGCVVKAGVVEPPVENGGSVVGAAQFFGVA